MERIPFAKVIFSFLTTKFFSVKPHYLYIIEWILPYLNDISPHTKRRAVVGQPEKILLNVNAREWTVNYPKIFNLLSFQNNSR